MNKTTKYALITGAGNLGLVLLLIFLAFGIGDNLEVALVLLLGLPILLLLVELVLGIVWAVSDTKKEAGAGVLIGLGLSLLIGLSACGIMINS